MTEPTAGGDPGFDTTCPWCSTPVGAGARTCPSCGAALQGPDDATTEIPGVTKVDPIVAARRALPKPNRLVGWLAGDLDPLPPADPFVEPSGRRGGAAGVAGAGTPAVAPPSDAVRREMARLELAAIKAELEARAAAAQDPTLADAEGQAPEDAAGR